MPIWLGMEESLSDSSTEQLRCPVPCPTTYKRERASSPTKTVLQGSEVRSGGHLEYALPNQERKENHLRPKGEVTTMAAWGKVLPFQGITPERLAGIFEYYLHYEVRHRDGNVIIQSPYRCRKHWPPDLFRLEKPITLHNYTSMGSYAFLDEYHVSMFSKIGTDVTLERAASLLRDFDNLNEYDRLGRIKQAIALCHHEDLRHLLSELVCPRLFAEYPSARIWPVIVDSALGLLDRSLRIMYAIRLYGFDAAERAVSGQTAINILDQFQPGSAWDLSAPLSILLTSSYPKLPGFQVDRLGLHFVFELGASLEYSPHYPSTPLDLVRTWRMARERVPLDPYGPEVSKQLAHRRYIHSEWTRQEFEELLRWLILSWNTVMAEWTDPCNFLDANGFLDPVDQFERYLTLFRIVYETSEIACTVSPYLRKILFFQLLDEYGGLLGTDCLESVLNPEIAAQRITELLVPLPEPFLEYYQHMMRKVLGHCMDVMIDGIWLKERISERGIRVLDYNPNLDIYYEAKEPISRSRFVADVLRCLRNSLHGYVSSNDRRHRFARRLSLHDGNVVDDLPDLSLPLFLGMLASPKMFVDRQALSPHQS